MPPTVAGRSSASSTCLARGRDGAPRLPRKLGWVRSNASGPSGSSDARGLWSPAGQAAETERLAKIRSLVADGFICRTAQGYDEPKGKYGQDRPRQALAALPATAHSPAPLQDGRPRPVINSDRSR